MPSLTPESRREEVAGEAANEGFYNGLCTLIPSIGAVLVAVQRSEGFRKKTNYQARTAIAIMPALFVASITSEMKLSQKMHEMAAETQHNADTVQWAEQEWRQQAKKNRTADQDTKSQQLSALYQQSVASSGVCVVPELLWYHKVANFTAQNPIKVLAAGGVPAVGYIFWGRTEQSHLQISSKIMHTRVFGQFSVLVMLLGIMGFKELMDQNGRFISQQQADDRVLEMQQMRKELLERLAAEKKRKEASKVAIQNAHKVDMKSRKNKRREDFLVEDAPVNSATTTNARSND